MEPARKNPPQTTFTLLNKPEKMSFDFIHGLDVFCYYSTTTHKIIGISFSYIPQKKNNSLARLALNMEFKKENDPPQPFTCLNIELVKMMSLFAFGGMDITPSISISAGVGFTWSTWYLSEPPESRYTKGLIKHIGVNNTVGQMNFCWGINVRFNIIRFIHLNLAFRYITKGNLIKNKQNAYSIEIARMHFMLSILVNVPLFHNKLCIGGGYTLGVASKKLSAASIENLNT